MSPAPVAGLVLAAGAGRRFGGPKAPVVVGGERLVDRAARVLREGGCDPVLVVLGAWVGEVPGAQVVVHPGWASGMGGSLVAGLDALERLAPRPMAVAIVPVDLPGLTAAAIARVLAAAADGPAPGSDALVAAAYEGERGHPVLLGAGHWAGARAAAHGDAGAREYLRGRAVRLVEVGDIASSVDVDRPDDIDQGRWGATGPGSGR